MTKKIRTLLTEKQSDDITKMLEPRFKTKDSGKRIDYPSGMRRDIQDGKPRYDLCYQPMFKRWAELMMRGAVKYGENNWQKANSEEELARFKASAYRHFFQYINDLDTEEDHAAAVFFNISAIEYLKKKLSDNKK